MKQKASISHEEAIVRELREDPEFAVEYLKAALEDTDEPRVLLIALRHITQREAVLLRSPGKPGLNAKVSTALFLPAEIPASQRL